MGRSSVVLGKVEGGKPRTRLSGFWDYRHVETAPLVLAEIPAKNPWEVFARTAQILFQPLHLFFDCGVFPHIQTLLYYVLEMGLSIPPEIPHRGLGQAVRQRPHRLKALVHNVGAEP